MMFYVYQIKFPSQQVYVGMTKNPKRRFRNHKKRIVNRLVNEQVDKYGWDKASFDIVSQTSIRHFASQREKQLIRIHSQRGRSLNYVHNDNYTYSDYTDLDEIDRDIEQLIVRIDKELMQRFKEKVKSEGRSMKWYINKWVKDYTYDRKEIKS